jgi:hypothetical protein
MVIWVCDFLDAWVDHEALDAFGERSCTAEERLAVHSPVSARIKRVPNWFRL